MAHEQVFDALGYQADADPSVTGTQADRAWVELVGPELLDDVERYTREHHRRTEAEAELRTARRDIATLQQAVEGNHAACQQLQRTYDLDIATLKRAVEEREGRIRDLLANSGLSGNVSEAAATGGVG